MEYLEKISAIDPKRIAYVDETGIDTYLQREYAYSKRGVKVIGRVSGKRYKRVGIVAAKLGNKIISPLQYEGTMNSELFEQWFENCLCVDLPSNSVIVMDNATFHRKSSLSFIAHRHGHKIIFLPPYSPELNPIENFWSWLKGKLRKVLGDFDCFDDALCYCFGRK